MYWVFSSSRASRPLGLLLSRLTSDSTAFKVAVSRFIFYPCGALKRLSCEGRSDQSFHSSLGYSCRDVFVLIHLISQNDTIHVSAIILEHYTFNTTNGRTSTLEEGCVRPAFWPRPAQVVPPHYQNPQRAISSTH